MPRSYWWIRERLWPFRTSHPGLCLKKWTSSSYVRSKSSVSGVDLGSYYILCDKENDGVLLLSCFASWYAMDFPLILALYEHENASVVYCDHSQH